MKFFSILFLSFLSLSAFALPVFNPQLVFKNQFGETTQAAPIAGTNYVAAFKSSTVTLSAAQVIALNATPIQLVAAQAGYLIQVVAAEAVYTKGASAFTLSGSTNLQIQYHTSAVLIAEQPLTGFIDQSSSKTAFLQSVLTSGIGIGGQAVEVTSDDSGITGGTGSTVAVTVYYNLLKIL